uniref:GAIN-B domain-containing protein n=1 Tax=Ciona savignyi TaxID=51511 RepID=H2YC95_CIOSA
MITLQRNLETMAKRVKLTNKTTFITATNNFDIEVHGTPRNTTNSSVQYSSFGNSTGITIPSEAINQAGRNSNFLKTVLVFYKNDLFFPSTYSNKTNAIDSVTTISFNTDNKITDLKQEVEIAFNSRHKSPPGREKNEGFKVNYVEQICVYYDAGTWKSNGCKYAYVNQIPTCRCNHLTSFALLFLNYPIPGNVHLELFTIIGCSLSISAFIIAVLLLLLNKKVRKRTSTKMQLHIFCNLAV